MEILVSFLLKLLESTINPGTKSPMNDQSDIREFPDTSEEEKSKIQRDLITSEELIKKVKQRLGNTVIFIDFNDTVFLPMHYQFRNKNCQIQYIQ